jgi:hypothetical protein
MKVKHVSEHNGGAWAHAHALECCGKDRRVEPRQVTG